MTESMPHQFQVLIQLLLAKYNYYQIIKVIRSFVQVIWN